MRSLRVACTARIGALHMDVQFEAARAWTVLFGPSGSGKSSVLRCIAGLWKPAECNVWFDAVSLSHQPAHTRRIALVAQQPALFPHMTIQENVLFAMRAHGAASSKAELRQRATLVLDQFRIGQAAAQLPGQLSGGETQRVALARAVASEPHLLLLDEVFTGLDQALARRLRSELRHWQQQRGTPILSVTHDLPEAFDGDEVVRLDNGRVTAQGTPSAILHAERDALLTRLSLEREDLPGTQEALPVSQE